MPATNDGINCGSEALDQSDRRIALGLQVLPHVLFVLGPSGTEQAVEFIVARLTSRVEFDLWLHRGKLAHPSQQLLIAEPEHRREQLQILRAGLVYLTAEPATDDVLRNPAHAGKLSLTAVACL
jgi:hypothetical protein